MPKQRKVDQDGLYQRDDSSYWWASYTDADQKRIRRSTGTQNRQEAEALLAKWKREAHQARQWDKPVAHSLEDFMRF